MEPWEVTLTLLAVIAAIIGIAWAIDVWLLPHPVIRPWILHRFRKGKPVNSLESPETLLSPKNLFHIRPIQSRGENIFMIDKKGELGGLDEFFVKTHFNLWTKYALEIINVEVFYDLPIAMPGQQKISIDRPENIYEETDSSYRMKERRKIGEGGIADIFVSRRFTCNCGAADHADYGTVTIAFEVASPAWKGIKLLTVKGRLNPGGKFNVSETSLNNGT